MMPLAKFSLWSALAVVLGGALIGLFWQPGPTREVPEQSAAARQAPPAAEAPAGEPARQPAAGRDLFNDPLPQGAVARLGTVAFRHGQILAGQGSLTYVSDGKHLISAGGSWVRRWNLATGHADINLGDGGRADRGIGIGGLVTADGKLVRSCEHVSIPGGGVTSRCTEYDLQNGKERTYRLEFPRGTQISHGLPHFLSPDGKTFVELNPGSRGITLWNAVNGDFTHYLKPEGVSFTALAFTPDSKTVIAGDDAHTFRVIDLATAKEQRSFGILNANAVALMAISPDGRWMVTVGGKKQERSWRLRSSDRFLRLWDLRQGMQVHTLDFPEVGQLTALLFTADSRTVVAAIRKGPLEAQASVRTWDVASGKPSRAWTDDPALGPNRGSGADGPVVAVSPDSKELATLNDGGVIRFWDMATGKERRALNASPCALSAVCFRPDGKTLWTVGSDGALREWEAATGRLLGPPRLRIEPSFPRFVAGGKLVVVYTYHDGKSQVRLQDATTGKVLLQRPGFGAQVSPDGKRFAIREDRPRVYDITTGKVLAPPTLSEEELKSDWPHRVIPRGFTADGQALILQGETVSVWDMQTGKQKSSWGLLKANLLKKPAEKQRYSSWERIESAGVSPDGRLIAFALLKEKDVGRSSSLPDWFGRLVILEMATGKLLHQADTDGESFRETAFSPDGKLLAAGGSWTVRVWDVATGKEVRSFEGHRGGITSLAFSPDGRRLASASEDSTVLIWDVAR